MLRAQSVIRINAKADRAPGEHGRANIVADCVAGEARQRRDAIGDVALADRPQREQIVEGEGAEGSNHAKRRQSDLIPGLLAKRGQHVGEVDGV